MHGSGTMDLTDGNFPCSQTAHKEHESEQTNTGNQKCQCGKDAMILPKSACFSSKKYTKIFSRLFMVSLIRIVLSRRQIPAKGSGPDFPDDLMSLIFSHALLTAFMKRSKEKGFTR